VFDNIINFIMNFIDFYYRISLYEDSKITLRSFKFKIIKFIIIDSKEPTNFSIIFNFNL
jgi:hypothetical protein